MIFCLFFGWITVYLHAVIKKKKVLHLKIGFVWRVWKIIVHEPCMFRFFPSSFPFQLWLEINFNQEIGASVSIWAQTCHMVHANSSVYLPQSSSHGGDQELVARMKSLEVENQTLHKGLCVCVWDREIERGVSFFPCSYCYKIFISCCRGFVCQWWRPWEKPCRSWRSEWPCWKRALRQQRSLVPR